MEEQISFMPLLLVILLAFIVPLALSRVRQLRLPVVVGEIIAGILVGRSGLGWVPSHDAVLDLLAQFGFVFLMFLAGMEIDFSNLGPDRPVRSRASGPDRSSWNPATLGGLTFVLTLALSTAIGLGLTALGLVRNPWMMALILSTTSLGVVMPVLKERGLSAGRFGQTILIAALVADFATMLLITVVVAALSRGITPDILLIGLLICCLFPGLLLWQFPQPGQGRPRDGGGTRSHARTYQGAPGIRDVLVLALRRNGELVVPHGNTQIGQGDHLTLVGLEEHVEAARQMLECAEV